MLVSLALALASSVHAVNLGVKFTGHMNLHLSVLSQNLASNCRNAELSAGIMTCQQAADSNNITLTAFSKLNPSMDCTLPLQDRTLFCVPDDFSPSVHGLPMLSNATTTADIHATGTTIFTGTIAAVARETSLATGSSALTTSTSESTTTTTESTTVDPTATTTSTTSKKVNDRSPASKKNYNRSPTSSSKENHDTTTTAPF
ncbi:hypothetical protein BC830DRAFT_1086378 [Chytriomyces sp. MP71]|nr:hypothetical protein BC830DRAFT_1086378 [Chytriomyces sp. MP71]